MTIQQILRDFKAAKKPICRDTFYKYKRRFRIKPLSKIRQRPQHYPADTTARLFLKLGLSAQPKPTSRR